MTRSIVLIRYSLNILLVIVVFLLVMVTEQGRVMYGAFIIVSGMAYIFHDGLKVGWKFSWLSSTVVCISTAYALAWS